MIPKDAYDWIVMRYVNGESKADIARDYDVSRERIRQIIKAHDPDAEQKRAKYDEEVEQQKLSQELVSRLSEVLANDLRCATCGGWVIREVGGEGENFTCSPECAEAWSILRTLPELSGDVHRIYMAKSILKNSDSRSEAEVAWAENMMGDDPPPPNRRFVKKGSKRARVLKKYRPEIYKELVS